MMALRPLLDIDLKLEATKSFEYEKKLSILPSATLPPVDFVIAIIPVHIENTIKLMGRLSLS